MPVSDQVGTVWRLLDSDIGVANSYEYDAFGVDRGADETLTYLYRFGTKRLDASTDVYHFLARQYLSAVGRMANRDSAQLAFIRLADPIKGVVRFLQASRQANGAGLPANGALMAFGPHRSLTEMNLYVYAHGTPSEHIDPLGLHATASSLHNYYHEIGWYSNTHGGTTEPYTGSAYEEFIDIRLNPFFADMCALIRLANSRDITQCLCLGVGIADVFTSPRSGVPGAVIQAADCACNILGNLDLACQRGVLNWRTLLYAPLTAADCMSAEIGTFLAQLHKALKSGQPLTKVLEEFYEYLADVGTMGAQNLLTQGVPWPASQAKACCRLATSVGHHMGPPLLAM